MSRAAPLLLALLAGCAQDLAMGDRPDSANPDGDTGVAIRTTSFWLEVEPVEGNAADAVVLPQRFGPYVPTTGLDLELASAVRVDGTVRASRLTGWSVAPVPTTDDPIAASLTLRDVATGGTFPARSEGDGRFATRVVPGLYVLLVQPDDPHAAASDLIVQALDDAHLDVRLPLGAPLWGRVRDAAGTPVPGAVVSAVRDDGFTTSAAATDDAGWYELRVEPGTWRVVTAEPPGDRRPTLLGDWSDVGGAGARVDVAWGPATRSELRLRLVHDGVGQRDVSVRVSSTALSGYDLGLARWSLETRTDNQGLVEVRVPNGVFAIEILPGVGDAFAPERIDDVLVDADVDLGEVAPGGFEAVSFAVTDGDAGPLPGATALCAEELGQRRTWLADADDAGLVALTLPHTPLRCAIAPPGSRPDLASTRLRVGSPAELVDLALGAGEPVSGRVVVVARDGSRRTAPYAVVRLVDEDGLPLATTLTGTDGAFATRIGAR